MAAASVLRLTARKQEFTAAQRFRDPVRLFCIRNVSFLNFCIGPPERSLSVPCKMDPYIKLPRLHKLCRTVINGGILLRKHVKIKMCNSEPCKLLPLQSALMCTARADNPDHGMSLPEQLFRGVHSKEAGDTGNQYIHPYSAIT